MAVRPWWESPIAAVAAAAIITFAVLGSAQHIPAEAGTREINAVGIVLGVVSAWSLLLRWAAPYLMVALVTGCLTAYAAMDFASGPAYLPFPLAIVSFGLVRPRKELYVVATLMVVAAAVAEAVSGSWSNLTPALVFVGWAGAAVLLAEVLRGRRERVRTQREAQRQQQQQALVEQQLGLARDLHDSVAHALTAINVQASIAERLAHRDPAATAEAASAIRQSSRAALVDLTSIVRSLRDSDEAPKVPDRGLAQVPDLVAQARRGGLAIDTAWRTTAANHAGDIPPALETVPAEVATAAYRLVQEALTNATRYAPGSHVSVEVDQREGLAVTVRDDGGDPLRESEKVQGSGHGLIGMAERVEQSGGTLHHGPTAPRGFEVVGTWEQM